MKKASVQYSPAPQSEGREQDPHTPKHSFSPTVAMAASLVLVLLSGGLLAVLWQHHSSSSSRQQDDDDDDYGGWGLSPSQFQHLLNRECSLELHQMSLASSRQLWKNCTEQEWKRLFSEAAAETTDNDETMGYPLIACDVTPDTSGGTRQDHLQQFFSVEENAKRNNDNDDNAALLFDPFVLYNGNDMTCFLVSCPATVATAAYAQRNKTDETSSLWKAIHLQPLLPMMKVATGTVQTATQLSSSSSIRIAVTLSVAPDTLDFQDRTQKLLQAMQRRGGRTATQQLCSVFPSTGPQFPTRGTVSCRRALQDNDEDDEKDPCQEWFESDNEFLSIASTEPYTRDVILELAVGGGDQQQKEDITKALLSLIAGLASQPSVIAIEIMPEMRPFVF